MFPENKGKCLTATIYVRKKCMNYQIYKLSVKEYISVSACAAGITVGIAILFYESAWACLIFPIVFSVLRKRTIGNRRQIRFQTLSVQFLDAMRAVSTALLGGYSMENAWKEAQNEIALVHGEESYMYRELEEINRSVSLRVPLENLLDEFGQRSGVEDIQNFSEVFSFAKRSGGDFVKMIETTTEHMRQKQDTERDISVAVASRKLEQNVMNVMPMFMLAYMKISSGDYLDVLYGNTFGVLFMTGCLALYFIAMIIAEKILSIRV